MYRQVSTMSFADDDRVAMGVEGLLIIIYIKELGNIERLDLGRFCCF